MELEELAKDFPALTNFKQRRDLLVDLIYQVIKFRFYIIGVIEELQLSESENVEPKKRLFAIKYAQQEYYSLLGSLSVLDTKIQRGELKRLGEELETMLNQTIERIEINDL